MLARNKNKSMSGLLPPRACGKTLLARADGTLAENDKLIVFPARISICML
jgi:hypothetical protein